MATTNLIVDYLIIGVSSLAWMLPVLLIVISDQWLCKLTDFGIATSFALLGGAYVLGISMSRFADDLTSRRNNKIRDEIFGKDAEPTYHSRLNLIILNSESATEYLSYRRSMIRITRACAVNFLVAAVAWPGWFCYTWFYRSHPSLCVTVVTSLACLAVFLLLYRAWPVVLEGYFYTVRDMYGFIIARNTENHRD